MARGPDSNSPIAVPNDSGHGIPITLYNAANVTDVSFTLSYNPALLNITGTAQGAGSDATDARGASSRWAPILRAWPPSPSMTPSPSPARWSSATSRRTCPIPPRTCTRSRNCLWLGNIVINQGRRHRARCGCADGMHVNAYFGDVTADGAINGLDTITANQVAIGAATGFAAYQLLDPVVIGDVANDLSVDAGDVSMLDLYVARLNPAANPGPRPHRLLPQRRRPDAEPWEWRDKRPRRKRRGVSPPVSTQVITVNLDHPHPAGSTGLTRKPSWPFPTIPPS